jgi:hypothetical protein
MKISAQALCKAYVNVASDPQVGTGQKAMQFWVNVKAVFEDLLVNVDDDFVERDQKALMHCFKHNIQNYVNWYNHHFSPAGKDNLSLSSFSDMCDHAAMT